MMVACSVPCAEGWCSEAQRHGEWRLLPAVCEGRAPDRAPRSQRCVRVGVAQRNSRAFFQEIPILPSERRAFCLPPSKMMATSSPLIY